MGERAGRRYRELGRSQAKEFEAFILSPRRAVKDCAEKDRITSTRCVQNIPSCCVEEIAIQRGNCKDGR